MRQPLIDADILLYEIGYAAEAGWQSPGFPTFDYAANLLDERIANICAIVEATEPPILYLTGKTNFRTEIAKLRPYKERPSLKPYHYKNLKAYIKGKYDWRLVEGLEADDLLAIEQTKRPNETIICSRDKDLRQVPGWHYGWELGAQPQFGPELVTEIGYLKLNAEKRKLTGVGSRFFYSQCLTGDSVDTVPGLPGYGPVKAFTLLQDSPDSLTCFNRVLEAYKGSYGDDGEAALYEQARLLWMVRETEGDKPVLWQAPKQETMDNGLNQDTIPS